MGAAIVAEGGVGGLACRTVVDAIDTWVFVHLVAVLVVHPVDGSEGRRMESDGTSRAVFVLYRTVEIGLCDLIAGGIADTQTALLAAFLGGDEHHAVAASRAVKGCSGGTFQDVDILNILLVDVVECGTPVASAAPFRHTAFVGHRHTVHYNQRLVVAKDAVVATDGDTRRPAVDTGGVDDLNACRAATEGANHASRTRSGDQVAFNFFGGITQFPFLAFDAQGSHHYVVKHLGVLIEGDIDFVAAIHLYFLGCEAHKAKYQSSFGIDLDAVIAVDVGDRTSADSLGGNGNTRQPQSVVAGDHFT